MNQRQFISACLKLFGLYLIFIGVPKLKDGSLEVYCFYHNSKNYPQTESIELYKTKIPTSIMSEKEKETYFSKNYREFMHMANFSIATGKVIDSIVLILLGLYLCRRGNYILNFVCHKEDIDNKIV